MNRAPHRLRRPRRDESGVSSIELVLYMPLLLLIMFIAVQFALVWFGNQAASAAAREAARVARVQDGEAAAREAARDYVANIGQGVLEDPQISVEIVGDTVRVTVTGRAQQLSPIGVPMVSQTVEGPIEILEAETP